MVKWSKATVGKGAVYIYIETIIVMISGYGFWIVMSKMSTAEVIGTSSALVSLANIFTVVAGIGISNGVQRFLGKSFSEGKIDEAKLYVKASFLFVCIGIVACSTIIFLARDWVYSTFKIDFALIIIAIMLVGSSSLTTLFRSVAIGSLNSQVLPKIITVSSTAKIFVAVILILMGTGVLGLTIGYTINHIISSILLGIVILTIFKLSNKNKNNQIIITAGSAAAAANFSHACKNIVTSSVVSWIPFLITTIGSQLGTIVIFGFQGSDQAGMYFIALTIVNGITGTMYSLFTVALPALSAMQDGRKRFTWHAIRLSALISLPFSSALIFYSREIMQLIGQAYIEASSSLGILLLSMLPTAVLTGVNALVYSYGNYKQVLAIGLATSIPRTILYFVLVPIYGSTGAAMSYTIGAIVGFAVSVVVANRIKMQMFWKDLAYILIIPTGIAFVLDLLHVNYIIGIAATLIISYISLLRLRILKRADIRDVVSMLPSNISNQVTNTLKIIDKKLNWFY
jgi:O-antigen/teichoic acid export membrane protein